MGSFANSLFKLMLGWLQGAVSAVWSAFTSENGSSLFNWIGRYWILIAGILCLIGMVADICVYILRWKPFRVWKGFVSRNGGSEIGKAYSEQQSDVSADSGRFAGHVRAADAAEPSDMYPAEEERQTPDLSQWETVPQEAEASERQYTEKPATVTNAGYTVPADSPYRRPAGDASARDNPGPETIQASRTTGQPENSLPVMARRRRRISVSDLFSDPEEELRPFDAPQRVIDSRKAYRDPVYPRGWNKGEENGE